MHMAPVDWWILAAYMTLSLLVGALLARRASSSVESFFAGGRSMGWGLLGVSIAATTFASDTPLAVVELVRTGGVAGQWLWWSFVLSHLLIAVLFARMWRASGVITDAEFLELRYGGRPASVLRAVKAFYLAVPINILTLGWVMLAMAQVTDAVVPWNQLSGHLPDSWLAEGTRQWVVMGALGLVAYLYSAASGLWGVVVTDGIQIVVALAGSFALAFFVLRDVPLSSVPASTFSSSPFRLPWQSLAVFIGVQWWANKYADGGGYLVQRLAAVRREEDAPKAVWVFALIHYFVRPWPWIVVGLASLAVFPAVTDHKRVYPMMMARFLPSGWLGVVVASFAAAFMSTVDTHLNWGSSYIVRDLYQKFGGEGARSDARALWGWTHLGCPHAGVGHGSCPVHEFHIRSMESGHPSWCWSGARAHPQVAVVESDSLG